MYQGQNLIYPPHKATASMWTPLIYLLPRGKSYCIYMNGRRGIRGRWRRSWVLEVLGVSADSATNSPVTLGKFLFLASISPRP